jgi:DHA2 family multidrug resistance protein-like MFS transporter
MMVGSMAEGPVGGWVADAWGWRAVFLVKVPFLLLMLALGYVTIPAGRRGESVAAGPRRWSPSEVVLVGSAVAAVLFALQQPAGRRLLALALLVAAAVLVAGWTRLPAAAPVVGLIRRRSFGLPVLALMLIASISGLMTFALPYFISDVLRHGPEALGVALLCFVAAGALVSPIAGALTDRHGAGRVAFAGGVLTVAGVLPLATLDAGAGAFDLSWRMAILGAGMALFNSPNMTSILQATPDGQGGTVGGVTNVGRTLGTTLGPALAALAWTASGGGLAGFRTAVAVLAGCAATGAFALLLARRPDASRKPAPSP